MPFQMLEKKELIEPHKPFHQPKNPSMTDTNQETNQSQTFVNQATTVSQFIARATIAATSKPTANTTHVSGLASKAAVNAHVAVTAAQIAGASATNSATPRPAMTGMNTSELA